MDHSGDKSAGSVDSERKDNGEISDEGSQFREPKCCTICRTTRTPLWRGGPSGPKSLCNACGIRYGKKRRELQGPDLTGKEKREKRRKSSGKGGILRVLGLGKDARLMPAALLRLEQRWPWRRLGEEEEAAVLLMALSSGFL
ncbi:GATA transcription factor 15 [Wolffia australiana]